DADGVLGLRTSGSTGAPRVAVFTAAALAWSVDAVSRSLALTPEDRVGVLVPLDHGFGLVALCLAGLKAGATVVDGTAAFPDARAAAVAGCTVLGGLPGVIEGLAAHLSADDRSRVRQVGVAGGPLHPAVAARLAEAFPSAVILHQYGCTEAGPRLTVCPSTDAAFGTGSVGASLPGVRLARVDGVLAFASPGQMTGYLGDPQATEAARHTFADGTHGWRTGDRARTDGRVWWIDGRVDDLVKVYGETVSLTAVEAAVQA